LKRQRGKENQELAIPEYDLGEFFIKYSFFLFGVLSKAVAKTSNNFADSKKKQDLSRWKG